MDAFVIGFIAFVFGMAGTTMVLAFARRDESRPAMTPHDWEVQMAASSLL